MSIKDQIRLKERQAEVALDTFEQSTEDLKRVWHAKLASRKALVLGFSGGLALGFLGAGRRRRKRHAVAERPEQRTASATRRTRESMPKHWLGHYIIWPFLLTRMRDLVVSRGPGRQA